MSDSFIEKDRIFKLEKALSNVIEYLHRLPINPETRRQADEAQAILDQKIKEITTFRSHVILPNLVPLISARVHGASLTLQTVNLDALEPWRIHRHRCDMYEWFKSGVQMRLSEVKGEDDSDDELLDFGSRRSVVKKK